MASNNLSPQQQSLFFNDEGENENIERKSCSDGQLPRDLWEVITAFSNAEGGYIYVGVNDDGSFIGLSTSAVDKLQKDLVNLCNTGFNQKIYIDITTFNGAIKAYVPPAPSTLRPIYSTSRGIPQGAKVRVGSANVQVDSHWVKKFAMEASGGAELQEINATPSEVIDNASLSRYIQTVGKKRPNAYSGLQEPEILTKLRAVNDNGKVTLFGLLAFGKDDELQFRVAPTVNIAVTQYPGVEKVDSTNVSDPFLDNKEFNGDALIQFREAYKFILSKIPIRGTIGPEGLRQDYLAVPDVAIRETLANAIAHRDYSDVAGRVQVDIYADRIEFSNPGTSLVPLKEIDSAPPRTRNPLLVNFLKDYGVTEQRARGIRAIKTSLREAGLKEPIFEHRHNSFFATIYNSAYITEGDRRWLSGFEGMGLNEHQLKAVLHLKHNQDGLNNSEYRQLNNMNSVGDDVRAKKELSKLVALGVLDKRGVKRHTRYYLPPIS